MLACHMLRLVMGLAIMAACDGDAQTELPVSCGEAAGSTTRLFSGVVVAMDADSLYYFDSTPHVLKSWPKHGGVSAVVTDQAWAPVTVTDGVFYWPETFDGHGQPTNVAMFKDGVETLIPLLTSNVIGGGFFAAPSGGVFFRTQTQTPLGFDTIDYVGPGLTWAEIIVNAPPGSYITGMAVLGDSLLWREDSVSAFVYKLRTIGTTTDLPLITKPGGSPGWGGDYIATLGNVFFINIDAGIEEHDRSGNLLGSYATGYPTSIAADTIYLYWTSPPYETGGPVYFCGPNSFGLRRISLASSAQDTLDPDGGGALVDDEFVFYTSSHVFPCCHTVSGPGQACSPPAVSPPQVMCFRK